MERLATLGQVPFAQQHQRCLHSSACTQAARRSPTKIEFKCLRGAEPRAKEQVVSETLHFGRIFNQAHLAGWFWFQRHVNRFEKCSILNTVQLGNFCQPATVPCRKLRKSNVAVLTAQVSGGSIRRASLGLLRSTSFPRGRPLLRQDTKQCRC